MKLFGVSIPSLILSTMCDDKQKSTTSASTLNHEDSSCLQIPTESISQPSSPTTQKANSSDPSQVVVFLNENVEEALMAKNNVIAFNIDDSFDGNISLGTESMSTISTLRNNSSNYNINLNGLKQQAYLYLDETDYNLLQKVTTQIGTFNPLPSSTTNPNQRRMVKPERFIAVLEARGSPDRDIDKNSEGHRKDTIPIAKAIDEYVHHYEGTADIDEEGEKKKAKTAVVQFLEENECASKEMQLTAYQSNLALKNYLKAISHGIVVRSNPGTLSPLSQKRFDDMLRELSDEGVLIMSHPDVMSTLGAKDSLVKIKDLKCGLEDTEVYYTPDSFRHGFCKTIAFQPRVIKQNRGSQGEGIWICKLKDESAYCDNYGDRMVTMDTELVLMEAFDNHIEHRTVGEFLDFCINGKCNSLVEWQTNSQGKYFEGGIEAGAMVVDQRFLPRIVEGEVRCLMIGSELVEILHKKPKDGGLSATLESGATYTKFVPDHPRFAKLVNNFKEDVPQIMDCFGLSDQPLPLLWTVDYINGESDDDFYAGEINCSCPGITQQLHIVPTIAKTAYKSVFDR